MLIKSSREEKCSKNRIFKPNKKHDQMNLQKASHFTPNKNTKAEIIASCFTSFG